MPTTDRGAIQQVIRTLVAGGWTIEAVDDGDGPVVVVNETQAVEAIMAVDAAHMDVTASGSARGWLYFVLGNDPEEVVNDHSTNLSPVLDPLFVRWGA